MSINTQFQTENCTLTLKRLKSQSVVEIKFAGIEMGEVAAVCPQISLNSCEVSSGRVNYGGRIIATVVYSDAEGKLCRVQKGAEFSHFSDDEQLAPAQSAHCTLKCERYQVKREGSSISVAFVVSAEIEIFEGEERRYLSSIDGAVCRTESLNLYSMVNFSGESEVEDEFDCAATDVLVPNAEALVLDSNVRAGFVEVSGEIYLSLLAVRDSSPVSLDRVIPFKCEVPCEEALLSARAFSRVEIKSLSVNCRVNEEKGKCGVEFNATLAFYGHFFEEEEISAVCDAFNKNSEISLTFAEESRLIDTDFKVYSERVTGPCAAKAKIDYTCAFLAAALPKAEFERTKEGIEGSISATLLFEQGGEIHSTEVNMPFVVTLSGLSENCQNINVAVCGMSLRQRAEGECEGEAVLKISCADGELKTARYVSEAVEGDEKKPCDCGVSVYFPAAGDGLWETAKRLSESPESIQLSNPDLKFPLTGNERIIIYRPKQG